MTLAEIFNRPIVNAPETSSRLFPQEKFWKDAIDEALKKSIQIPTEIIEKIHIEASIEATAQISQEYFKGDITSNLSTRDMQKILEKRIEEMTKTGESVYKQDLITNIAWILVDLKRKNYTMEDGAIEILIQKVVTEGVFNVRSQLQRNYLTEENQGATVFQKSFLIPVPTGAPAGGGASAGNHEEDLEMPTRFGP